MGTRSNKLAGQKEEDHLKAVKGAAEKTDMNHGKQRGDASVEYAVLTEGTGYI